MQTVYFSEQMKAQGEKRLNDWIRDLGGVVEQFNQFLTNISDLNQSETISSLLLLSDRHSEPLGLRLKRATLIGLNGSCCSLV